MAARIGQLLRETRTKRGIELDEVERVTKIRVRFLQALEEERWNDLPAPVYARGFLATYAQFLDLDDRALVDEYRRTFEPAGGPEIPPAVIRPGKRRGRPPIVPAAMLLAGLACVAALVLGLVALVGSFSGSDDDGDRADQREGRAGPTTETTTERAGEVSVELRSTGAVWVCLVDDRDRELVDGETLPANQARGPFDGRAFDVTFGNGSVEMTVDGVPADIPPVAEPLGYRITASGVRTLESSSQPSCL